MLGQLESLSRQLQGLSCHEREELGASAEHKGIALKAGNTKSWTGMLVSLAVNQGVSQEERAALIEKLEGLCELADKFSTKSNLKARLITPIKDAGRCITKHDLAEITQALESCERASYEHLTDWFLQSLPLVLAEENCGAEGADPRLVAKLVTAMRGEIKKYNVAHLPLILPRALDRARSQRQCHASFVEAAKQVATEYKVDFFAPDMTPKQRSLFVNYRSLFGQNEISDMDLHFAVVHNILDGAVFQTSGVKPKIMRTSVNLPRIMGVIQQKRLQPERERIPEPVLPPRQPVAKKERIQHQQKPVQKKTSAEQKPALSDAEYFRQEASAVLGQGSEETVERLLERQLIDLAGFRKEGIEKRRALIEDASFEMTVKDSQIHQQVDQPIEPLAQPVVDDLPPPIDMTMSLRLAPRIPDHLDVRYQPAFAEFRKRIGEHEFSDNELVRALEQGLIESAIFYQTDYSSAQLRALVDLDNLKIKLAQEALGIGSGPAQVQILSDDERAVKDILMGSNFTIDEAEPLAIQLVQRQWINTGQLRAEKDLQNRRDLVSDALGNLKLQESGASQRVQNQSEGKPRTMPVMSLRGVPSLPDPMEQINRLKDTLYRLEGSREKVDALVDEGLLNFEVLKLYANDVEADGIFRNYLEQRKAEYRREIGPLPGEQKDLWQSNVEQFQLYLHYKDLRYEILNALTRQFCELCSEPGIPPAQKEELIQIYFDSYLPKVSENTRKPLAINLILQNVEKFRPRMDQRLFAQLEQGLLQLVPEPELSPLPSPVETHPPQSLTRPETGLDTPGVEAMPDAALERFESALSYYGQKYKLSERDLEIIKRMPPVDIESRQFENQIFAWAALRDKKIPLSFLEFHSLASKNLITEEMCGEVIVAYGRWDKGSDRQEGKRLFKEAAIPIMRAFCKSHPALAAASDTELENLTVLNLWNPRLKSDLDAMINLYAMHSVLSDQHLNTRDIAYAASEHLVTPREAAHASTYVPDEVERMKQLRRQASGDAYVQTMSQVPEVGERSRTPSLTTFQVCDELVRYHKNPDVYFRAYMKSQPVHRKKINTCIKHLGLATAHISLSNQYALEDNIRGWCGFKAEDQQWPAYLCDVLRDYIEEKRANPTTGLEFFKRYDQAVQDHMRIMVWNMGNQQLSGMAERMQQYTPLLEASSVTGQFAKHIVEREDFQNSYNRPEVTQFLVNELGSRLGQKTVPDGSCGFHAIAHATGDSPLEVRRRCAWAARDIDVYMRTGDVNQLSSTNPAYIDRVVRVAQQRLQDEEELIIAFESAPGNRVEFLDHPLEEEGVPDGRVPEDYWMKTEDLQFVSVAYGRPSIYVINPGILIEGNQPVEYCFNEFGERELLWGDMDRAHEVLGQKGIVGLMNLGRKGWEHWEPIVPLPPHRRKPRPVHVVPEPVAPQKDPQKYQQRMDQQRGYMESLRVENRAVAGQAFVAPELPVKQLDRFRVELKAGPHFKPKNISFTTSKATDTRIESVETEVELKETVEREDVGIVAKDKPTIQGQIVGTYPSKWAVGMPLDPNLVCPKCNIQYQIGGIQYLRRHVNDYDHEKE
ncbi:OTU domain-containing protein [Endozoicomonas arenosclerae]|uniref:OTU domain-containing protein n=1 Tax=Endozoicomonas arenosclerae TaxID=1633495 RepID=UPI0007866DD7|nr:OTU domain-containing protein [Endozoicomonas arenosclerae]